MLDYDFEVVRTDRFPGQIWSAIVTSGDDVVLTGDIRTRESVGHYLHILRSSGEILSYGEDGGVYPSQSTNRPFWGADVAGKDDDTVWVIPPGANRILRWDLRPGPPQVGRVLERRVAAFDEDAMPGMYPGSYVNGGVLDDRGLWIMWHTPDPEWTERVPEFETETEPPQQARQGVSALRQSNWYADGQYIFVQHAEGIRDMIEAGVKVAMGGHGDFDGPGLWSASCDRPKAISPEPDLPSEIAKFMGTTEERSTQKRGPFGRRPRLGAGDGQYLLALTLLGALMPSDSLAGQERECPGI